MPLQATEWNSASSMRESTTPQAALWSSPSSHARSSPPPLTPAGRGRGAFGQADQRRWPGGGGGEVKAARWIDLSHRCSRLGSICSTGAPADSDAVAVEGEPPPLAPGQRGLGEVGALVEDEAAKDGGSEAGAPVAGRPCATRLGQLEDHHASRLGGQTGEEFVRAVVAPCSLTASAGEDLAVAAVPRQVVGPAEEHRVAVGPSLVEQDGRRCRARSE
mmetsp:Transcript_33492/g.99683  ORF Transcript_33492/g.99683 Transcript_33492/m.99683 type:complete len:218 (+) Transcript_33492:607-1260(+)